MHVTRYISLLQQHLYVNPCTISTQSTSAGAIEGQLLPAGVGDSSSTSDSDIKTASCKIMSFWQPQSCHSAASNHVILQQASKEQCSRSAGVMVALDMTYYIYAGTLVSVSTIRFFEIPRHGATDCGFSLYAAAINCRSGHREVRPSQQHRELIYFDFA